jgi:biopolymer transport protein ExbD
LSGVRPTVKRLCAEESLPVVIQVSETSRSGLMIRIIDEARLGGAKDVSVAAQRS